MATGEGTAREDILLGQLAVKQRIISPEQLAECLKEQRASNQKLGQILIGKNYVTEEVLSNLLEKQVEVLSCQLAKKIGITNGSALSEDQANAFKTISMNLAAVPHRLFECRKCSRKYRIPDAKRGKVYRCVACETILDQFGSREIETLVAAEAELVLEEAIPKEVQEALKKPENIFGRYVLTELLGEGAAGDVYKAYDLELQRYVALKFIRTERVEMLKHEARILAGIEHKNIARLYDIGISKSKGFIAMQYIKGKPLDVSRFSLEQSLKIIANVCEAVAYAHSQKIIHRDIKPANIMISDDEAGSVFIMDFGVSARNPKEGEITGTPGFMSPEVADGVAATVQSDVYSVGATLYYLISGRLPIKINAGEKTYLIMKKCRFGIEEPIEHVAANVPPEVAAIVRMATEKYLSRRYATVEDLLDDIKRYQAGDPVRAYSSSPTYYARKLIRKRLALFIAGFIAVCGLAGFAITNYVSQQKNEEAQKEIKEREEAARRAEAESRKKEEENKQMRERYTAMVRDISRNAMARIKEARQKGKAELVRLTFDTMKEQLELAYKQAQTYDRDNPEPDFLLGRIQRAMLNFGEALRFQEQALRKNAAYGPALYEMAILLARTYDDEVARTRRQLIIDQGTSIVKSTGGFESENMRGLHDPTGEEITKANPKIKEIEGKTLEILARLEKVKLEAFGDFISPAGTNAAAGIMYLYRHIAQRPTKEMDVARKYLYEALSKDKTLEEVYEAIAMSYPDLDSREKILLEGRKSVPGYFLFSIALGDIAGSRGIRLARESGDPTEMYEKARQFYTEAITINDNHAEAYFRRGTMGTNIGVFQMGRGADPTGAWNEAEADFSRGTDLDPKNSNAFCGRGTCRLNRAVLKINSGGGFDKDIESAVKDFSEAIKLDTTYNEAWKRRGNCWNMAGVFRRSHGMDPLDSWKKADGDYVEALKLNPVDIDTWLSRGMMRANRGIYMQASGKDPSGDYKLAEQDYLQALKIDSRHSEAWMAKGAVLSDFASYLAASGGEPVPVWKSALEDFGRSLEILPEFVEALRRRGELLVNRANFLMREKEDMVDDLEQAGKDLEAALKISPNDSETWSSLGLAHDTHAVYAMKVRKDPSTWLELAESDFRKSIAINPNSSETHLRLGDTKWNGANYFERRGKPELAIDGYEKCIAAWEKAIDLHSSANSERGKQLETARKRLVELKKSGDY